MAAPVTLSWLRARGLNIWVWCEACSHSAILAPDPLLARLGDYAIPDLGQRLYCSQCRSRAIFARPDWPRQGLVSRAQGLDDLPIQIGLTPAPLHGKQET